MTKYTPHQLSSRRVSESANQRVGDSAVPNLQAPIPNPQSPISIRRLWPLLLPLLLFLPGLTGFPYPSAEAVYSDIAISHYPNAVFLKRVLQEHGSIPLWSPNILSGYPFAANPLSGLWYPLGWLALIFPLPLGFNVLVVFHLLWGGLGMYRLLRVEGLSHRPALLGALAFEAMPKLFAHYGAGHLTLLYAIPWTPWLLWASHRFVPSAVEGSTVAGQRSPVVSRQSTVGGRRSTPIILALIFLADPRWAAYAGLIWLAYSIAHSQINYNADLGKDAHREDVKVSSASPATRHSPHTNLQSPISNPQSPISNLLSQLILTALLIAPLALPLLEYARISTRSALSAAESFTLSLPPARLLGLIFPNFGGNHEWMLYPGGVILVLGLVAILNMRALGVPSKAGRAGGRQKFWLCVGLLTLIYSLGSNIPLLPYLARLPGFDLLRVPSRALFLTGMALAALAAYGANALLVSPATVNHRRVNLTLPSVSLFTVLLMGFVWFFSSSPPANFIWGAGVIVMVSVLVMALLRGRISPSIWFALILGLALIDLGMENISVLTFRTAVVVLSEHEAAAQYLADQPGQFRVYSPSYSLPQQVAIHYGLELADGVDPLQLAAYADFMDGAAGVPRLGYSVTLPPFAEGDPARDNAAYRPDPALLGLLNIRYVVAEYDLPVNGLILRARFGETRVYENEPALPRAWVQPLDADVGEGAVAAEVVEWMPNRVIVTAQGPGLLVLSEIAYPGWRVSVDGESAPLATVAGMLRGVELGPGAHTVAFTFRPRTVYLGLASFIMGAALLVTTSIRLRRK